MLIGYLGAAISLPVLVEDENGPVDLTLYTVKACLVNSIGTAALSPVVTCSGATDGADHANGKAVALWTVGTYPLLTVGQCQLELSLTKAGVLVPWPRIPVELKQGFAL